MKKLDVNNIISSDFHAFGRYTNLLSPDTPFIGEEPIRFYRDMMPLSGHETLSLSITLVDPMPKRVEVLEYHSTTGECFLTLDEDTYICVAPATVDSVPKIEEMRAFYVPKGVAVYIYPGVWHYAPYPVGNHPIHSLVMLPERTYANDCIKYEFMEENVLELNV